MNKINFLKSSLFYIQLLITIFDCISAENCSNETLFISQCEIIPVKSQNSTFNGIQRYCSDNREKYRPCKVNASNLNGDWTTWSEWNCDDCFKKEKLAKRSRKCLGFFEGYFCITDKRGVSDFELMDCDEVCYKVWSEWSSWSPCNCTSLSNREQSTRVRSCNGYGKICFCNSYNSSETECYVETKECDLFNITNSCNETLLNTWSKWGEWSECYSNGQMSRKRTCNKTFEYNFDCVGSNEEYKKCGLGSEIAVHGGFSKWSEWTCHADICQKGWATRFRKCNNPKPSLGGFYCYGPDTENKECENWNNNCTDTLNKKMIELSQLTRQFLDTESSNFVKKEFETLKLEVNENLIYQNREAFSNTKLFWYLNGKNMVLEKSRMISKDNFLLINQIKYNDTGTYYCVLQMDSFKDVVSYEDLVKNHTNQFIVIGVYTLVVISSQVVKVSPRNITNVLDCKQESLEIFYQKKNFEILRHMNGLMFNSKANLIKKVEFFLCEIRERNSSRFWYTNLVRINSGLLSDNIHLFSYFLEEKYSLFPLVGVFYLIVIMILTKYIEEKNYVFLELTKSFIRDLNLKG